MKIVHVITAFGIGGAENLLLNVINQQVEEHEVYLIYLKRNEDLIDSLNPKVHIKYISLGYFTLRNLKEHYQKVKPDIIHTHLGHADFLGMWSTRKMKVKRFCTMHNIYFSKTILDAIYFQIYKFLFSKRSLNIKVISISRSVEKHVVEKLKLPPQRSYLLYNAISRKENNSMKNNSRKKELLYVGRLEKQKSVETLLRSLTKIENRNVNLTIVGDGSLKNKLQNEAVRLGVHNMVTFTGAQKNVQSFYNTADVFVLPSIWEGFGIVILEAFRSGIPVIASNLEGPSELIEHNANGLLFEPKNSDQLASLIKKLIDNDEERKRLGENGYQTFLKNYDINTYVQKLYEIYLDD